MQLNSQIPQFVKKSTFSPSEILMNMNVNLSLIIQTVSQMKHTFHPSFIAAYILILRSKIIICPQNDPFICFCPGCLLSRRFLSMLKKDTQWCNKIIQQLNKDTQQLPKICKNIDNLFCLNSQKKQTAIQKIIKYYNQQKLMQQLTILHISQWQASQQMCRFFPILQFFNKILRISCTRIINDQILDILAKIKNTKTKQDNLKLKNQLQKIFDNK